MSYGLEVDMIKEASGLGLLTSPYVFNPDDAVAMTKAGADVLVPHGSHHVWDHRGADSQDAGRCVVEIQAIHDAAVGVNEEIVVLCHGGPLAEPDDAQSCPRPH